MAMHDPQKRLNHLLLVTLENAADPRSWSGIPHSLRNALAAQVPQLTVVDGTQLRPRKTPLHSALRAGLGGGAHPRWPLWMTEPSLRHYASVVQQAIAQHKPDAVLSISSQCIARLHTAAPLFMFHDAPWLTFKQTYRRWEPVPLAAARFARAEAQAAGKTRLVFTGSAWSVAESMKLYGLPRGRFVQAPLGANWEPAQSSAELLAYAQDRAADLAEGGTLHLLFLGKDWERKGGPLALETAILLNQQGCRTQLHIVGCRPPLPEGAEAVAVVHGVLDLGDAAARQHMEQLFFACHFLLVPTQAECFGIAFAESQGFAVPPVSRAVDALPSIVLDGETGILLPPDAGAARYAARIAQVANDAQAYVQMAAQAREWFTERLTWRHTARTIVDGIEGAIEGAIQP